MRVVGRVFLAQLALELFALGMLGMPPDVSKISKVSRPSRPDTQSHRTAMFSFSFFVQMVQILCCKNKQTPPANTCNACSFVCFNHCFFHIAQLRMTCRVDICTYILDKSENIYSHKVCA